MDKLPDKIIHMDIIRANWNFRKRCTCENRTFVLDPRNREVHCGQCGELVDAFDAMMELCNNYERINEQMDSILKQKKELSKYKPRLEVIKKLEKEYRGKKMLPCCPICNNPFYLEEIRHWMGWSFGEAMINRRKDITKEEVDG